MEDYKVSLKNIYRMLRVNDYPVYSNGIIPKAFWRGMTLVKFWQQILLYRWRSTPDGKIIWRTQGSKNRFHSELCNRRARFPFYKEYISEIINELTPEEFIFQTKAFSDFLSESGYDHEILWKKLNAFLQSAEEDDVIFSTEAARYFRQEMKKENTAKISAIQMDSWILSMLTLHAIAGDLMNDEVFSVIRNKTEYRPEYVFAEESRQHDECNTESILLTDKNCELWYSSIRLENFYGREQEMFDLKDAVRTSEKLVLSGIGGVGKTELLRQLLRVLMNSGESYRIATVQYENSFEESFALHFNNLRGSSAEECFHEVIHLLSSEDAKQTVLMIDNVNSLNDDPKHIEMLKNLSCTVLITSRLPQIPGFSVYHIEEPDLTAASLIFRNNYGKVLTAGYRKLLKDYLSQRHMRHPLTLSLLGKYAGNSRQLFEELLPVQREMISQIPGVYEDEEKTEKQFYKVYRKLYSLAGLSDSETDLLRLFSVLPYRKYDMEQILLFSGFEANTSNAELLYRLAETGWLEQSEQLWSMHPVIAEGIQKKNLSEKDFGPLFQALAGKLEFSFSNIETITESQREAALLLIQILNKMTKPISWELAMAAVQSGLVLWNSPFAGTRTYRLIDSIIRKCADPSDELMLYAEMIHICGEEPQPEECEKLLAQQRENQTVSDDLLNIFKVFTAGGFVKAGRIDEALRICDDVDDAHLPEYFHYDAIVVKVNCLQHKMQFNDADKLLSDCLKDSGFINAAGSVQKNRIYLMAGENAANKGDLAAAKAYLEPLSEMVENHSAMPHEKIHLLTVLGGIAMLEDNLQEAAGYFEEQTSEAAVFFGRESQAYLLAEGKLAVLYNKMGDDHREKSYECHEETIDVCERLLGEGPNLQVFLNNYAVALLDGHRPEKALEYLDRAYRLAEGMSLLAKAEPAYQMSRAWREKGNSIKERQYLEEAYPVFMEVYGPDHPKTKTVKEKLGL